MLKTPPKRLQLQMRVDMQFLNAIDDWRAAQRPVLSRSEAIRSLCYKALAVKRK